MALQARWAWLQRPDTLRSWAEFHITIPKEANQLFQAATRVKLGNGNNALFWEDRWFEGFRIVEIASSIYERIPKKTRTTRTVPSALCNNLWCLDIGPSLNDRKLQEYLHLWPRIMQVRLDEAEADAIYWGWEPDRNFLARSAYTTRFARLEHAIMVDWKSWAPLTYRVFSWLAIPQ